MDCATYQKESRKFAFYPNPGKNWNYTLTGLIGEVGEAFNKLKKLERDFQNEPTDEPEKKKFREAKQVKIDEIIDELGDVYWYIANLASEIGVRLETFCLSVMPYRVVNSPFYRLASACGALSDIAIIANEEDDAAISATNLGYMRDYIENCYTSLYHCCKRLGTDITVVAEKNIAKLTKRRDESKLSGSGDKR